MLTFRTLKTEEKQRKNAFEIAVDVWAKKADKPPPVDNKWVGQTSTGSNVRVDARGSGWPLAVLDPTSSIVPHICLPS